MVQLRSNFSICRGLGRMKLNKIGFIVLILFIMVLTMWLYAEMNSTALHRTPQLILQKLGLLKFTINKKWIVVTSINPPTEQIEKLSQIPEWKLLVVADKKTPKNWTHPNVIIFSTEAQLRLGYHFLEFLPWNSYTMKIIGYLYAIEHGAEFIYDTMLRIIQRLLRLTLYLTQ